MAGHFCAFSFVDRITSVEPGVCIRGHYSIPPALDAFPVSLVAEAVGQLAAWSAMAAIGFTHRPVAGIADRIELLSAVRAGQVLDLDAEIESVDTETVGYSGTAYANAVPVIRLQDCVGPMVPMAEFDDPQALRERFALLRTGGIRPGAFSGLPALTLEQREGEPTQLVRASLQVPFDAPFFADHFPRRPVFPGTLLLSAKLQTAALLSAGVPTDNGAVWSPTIVSDVKLRSFIPPGAALSLEARRIQCSDTSLNVAVESRINQRLIGSAEIEFAPELKP